MILENLYTFEVVDSKTGEVTDTRTIKNFVPDQGLDAMLGQVFKNSPTLPTMYLGLIDSGNIGYIATSDTMMSKMWSEYTDYSGDRGTLVWDGPSGQSVSNSSNKITFIITTGNPTMSGAFLVGGGSYSKTNASGYLLGVAAFAEGNIDLDPNHYLRVTVTISAASA